MPDSIQLAAKEAVDRINTIHWVTHVAMISMERYRLILTNPVVFASVFPGASFDNPRIDHLVEGHGALFTTTKRELLEPRNHDLFKAWQIVLAVTGMSSVLDTYLDSTVERITKKHQEVVGIFKSFSKLTRIRISEFGRYERVRHYHEVRNISLHNLGRTNQRFRNRTAERHHSDGPYVFFPHQMREYRDLLEDFIGFVEGRAVAASNLGEENGAG